LENLNLQQSVPVVRGYEINESESRFYRIVSP
jgi:hypothetical protein